MRWPSLLRARLDAWLRRLDLSDAWFALVLLGFTFATARVWWLSAIVPGMDYPQYLVFVRALQDYANPASPCRST
jgi:hypothetical protein